jgi:hypothetical protein
MRSMYASSLSWLAHLNRAHWKYNASVLCCESAVSLSADRNSPCLKNWECKTDSKNVSVSWGFLSVPEKKDSGLSQNFICSLLTRFSLRNAKSTASNYLTIANTELEIMWNTPAVRMVLMLVDSKTAPLSKNQKLYRVSHKSVSKIDRMHYLITGLVFRCSQS